jgi:hypothetical protein
MSLSKYVQCRDMIVGILKEMSEFHLLTDIIPVIGHYISNGQRLLFQYKHEERSKNGVSASIMIAVQLSLLSSSLSSSTITTPNMMDELKCDIQHLGEVPTTLGGCSLIIGQASPPLSSSSSSHTDSSSNGKSRRRGLDGHSTMIYARSRPTTKASPNLVSWNMDTNEVTSEVAPLLLSYYDSVTTMMDHHLIFFGAHYILHIRFASLSIDRWSFLSLSFVLGE